MPRTPAIPGQQFFGTDAPPRPPHFLVRTARSLWRLGVMMLALGTAAVFVLQMPFLYQVILGAPIFEELWKLGLAVALVAAPRVRGAGRVPAVIVAVLVGGGLGAAVGALVPGPSWLWAPSAALGALVVAIGQASDAVRERRGVGTMLALPTALLVGGFFGLFEHAFSYAGEETVVFIGRVVFHSSSAVLSMVCLHALLGGPDVRVLWWSTLPATVLHYLNNGGAVVLGVLSLADGGVDAVALAWGGSITLLTVLAVPAAWAAPGWVRWAGRTATRHVMP